MSLGVEIGTKFSISAEFDLKNFNFGTVFFIPNPEIPISEISKKNYIGSEYDIKFSEFLNSDPKIIPSNSKYF